MRTDAPYTASTQRAAMRRAFDAAWATIRAHETEDDKGRDQELRVALNETLIALAAEGITDAQQLRSEALQRTPLIPRKKSDAGWAS